MCLMRFLRPNVQVRLGVLIDAFRANAASCHGIHSKHFRLFRTGRVAFPCFKTLTQNSERSSQFEYRNYGNWLKHSYEYLRNKSVISITAVFGVVLGYAVLLVVQRYKISCTNESLSAADDDSPPSDQEFKVREQPTVSLDHAIKESDEFLNRFKMESNCPGLVIAVTVNGQQVWSKGYGLSDVENMVPCMPATVMRIASISKPLTMVAIAKLWEDGKLDLDKPVQDYVPSWPDKTFKGQKVTITSRHLVSMMGGVRHYDKSCGKDDSKKAKPSPSQIEQTPSVEKKAVKSEFDNKEYYIRRHYNTVAEALDLFKDDDLCSLPGTEYLYSSHAWTLLSAVVEGASARKFTDVMKDVFRDLGLEHTYLDEDGPIIPNRSRYYIIDKKTHRLVNAPYVDNSYKWAGGGFLSTVSDLCHFGNAMLYSYQWTGKSGLPRGFLKPETVQMMWSPVKGTKSSSDIDGSYGMGWGTVPAVPQPGFSRDQRMYVSHTGGAIGASSVLLILPMSTLLVTWPFHGECVLLF